MMSKVGEVKYEIFLHFMTFACRLPVNILQLCIKIVGDFVI